MNAKQYVEAAHEFVTNPPTANNSARHFFDMNQQADQVVLEILNDSGKSSRQYQHPRYGNVLEITDSKGRGLLYTADQSSFIGFREP